MAFKMKGSPIIAGTQKHSSALTAKKQLDSSLKAMGASPMNGNAFGLAMEQAGGDYEKAKQILEKKAVNKMKAPGNMNSPADAMKGSPADANMKDSPGNANMKDSPGNANMKDSPGNAMESPADAMKSPADAMESPADAMESPAKILPAVLRVGSLVAPTVIKGARTQGPKILKNIGKGTQTLKSKGKKLLKDLAIGTGIYGAGYFSKDKSNEVDKKVKNQIDKNKTKTTTKTTKSDPYSRAKKNDPNLDNYIRERKKHKKGSPEYNRIQNKINKAYGVSKRHPVGGTSTQTQTVTSKQPSKADIKKTKIQTKASKRISEIDENVARKSTRKAFRTAKKSGTAQQAADAKVKMLEAKLADVTGAGGGRKQVIFGKTRAKNIQKKLEKARQKAGSPANRNYKK